MKNIKSFLACCFLIILGATAQAQHIFNLDAKTATEVEAAVYLPTYATAIFFSENEMFFYEPGAADGFQAVWQTLNDVEVTAALRWSEEIILLFDGSSYTTFNPGTAELGTEWEQWLGFPANWRNKVDAAVRWDDNTLFFTFKDNYLLYDINTQAFTQSGALSDWEGWPASWQSGIDAAINLSDNHIYFLSGNELLVYDMNDGQFYQPHTFETQDVASAVGVSTFPANRSTGEIDQSPTVKTQRRGDAATSRRFAENAEAVDEEMMADEEYPEEEEFTVVDAYLDNYPDHTAELANDASDWTAQPLPGLDWLGAGFDILRYDPLEPNELKNRKKFRTVLMTNSPDRAGNKGQYLKPYGTFFGSANSGSNLDSSSWITSYQSFQNSFSVGVSGSVSVPKVATSSLSGSYSEMNSTSIGSEKIFLFNRSKRKLHQVDIRLDWIDRETGQKYKQKVDLVFRKDVDKLPVPKASLQELQKIKLTKRGERLPRSLAPLKSKYQMLINKYGTHFASSVAWGGQYISRTQIKRQDFEKARMTKVGFQQSAEVQIKKVKVGRTVDFDMSDGEASGNSRRALRRDIYIQGGNGEDDLDKWRNKVDENPAPVEISFTAIADLLTDIYFPDDENIELKKEALRILTEYYILNTYRLPKDSKNNFFRDLPDLPMPGNISIKNGGGYVMWFKVKYEHKGKWHTKETDNYTLGFTKSIEIPVGAKNITVTAEHTFGQIFTETLKKPGIVNYKCWGTVFDADYEKTTH